MGRNRTSAARFPALCALLFCALFAAVVLAVCVGKYPVTPLASMRILFARLLGRAPDAPEMTVNVVMGLRVPRILGSVLVGAALSVSGAAYQGIFNNPLISPDFLGVSSGACVGAALAILLALPGPLMQAFAFLGGVLAVGFALLLPLLLRNRSNIMLVLSGVIVGAAMSSVLGFLKYVADPETQLAAITYWTMGSFSYLQLPALAAVLPTTVLPALLLYLLCWRIDILSMGSDDAQSLGVNVPLVRTAAILCATFMTASSVCIAGTISWVGLVIPHFSRMLAGPEHGKMLPVSALLGGLFMLCVDTATRCIGTTEMPVSILTGVIGAPLYAYFLYRERSRAL